MPHGAVQLSWSTRPNCTASGKLRLPIKMMPARPGGEVPAGGVDAGAVDAEALEHAPGAVEDVHGQGHVGGDVDEGDGQLVHRDHDVVVGVATHPVVIEPAPGEVGEMEEEVQQDDGAGDPHRAAGVVRGDVVAAADVGLLPVDAVAGVGLPAHRGERVRRVHVHDEGGDQHDADRPQQPGPGNHVDAQLPKRLGVLAYLEGTLVDVEVADHVAHDEAEQHDATDRHDPLAPDGALIEVQREGPFLGTFAHRCGTGTLHRLRHELLRGFIRIVRPSGPHRAQTYRRSRNQR